MVQLPLESGEPVFVPVCKPEGEVQLIAESPDRLTVVRTLPGERYTYTLTRE